jgi:CTP:molybdopterin cytidylyltransferase MocA
MKGSGARGHPVLIRRGVADALAGTSAASMRTFLASYRTTPVPLSEEDPFIDLDTPTDLGRYRDRINGISVNQGTKG